MEFYLITKVQEEAKHLLQENKMYFAKILGSNDILYLGNLNAKKEIGVRERLY